MHNIFFAKFPELSHIIHNSSIQELLKYFEINYDQVILVYLNTLGPSWPWSYGSRIYNYLCNRCLWPLMLRVRLRARCTTLCDKVCQWLAAGQWFSPGTPVSSTNKTDHHDITEILLKVVWNTIKPTNRNTLNEINYDYVIVILVYLNTLNFPLILESLSHSVHSWRSIDLMGCLSNLSLKYFNSFFCRTNHRIFHVWNIDQSN